MALFRIKLSMLLVGLLTLPSCSMVQVHVDLPHQKPLGDDALVGDLAPALNRAVELRTSYTSAVKNQSIARNGLALTAIPAAAAGMALGIANPSAMTTSHALLGIAGGTAAAFGVGSFLINPSYNAIYEAGSTAVTCAIDSVRPWRYNKDEFAERRKQVFILQDALRDATGSGVDSRSLTEASQILNDGLTLVDEIERSGPSLDVRLSTINEAVSMELSKAEPDLNSLQKVIAGLAPRMNSFAAAMGVTAGSGGPGRATGAAGSAQSGGGPDSGVAQTRLLESMVPVRAWVMAVNAAKARIANSGQCAVSVMATQRLSLDPDNLTLNTGETGTIVVHGLSGPDWSAQSAGAGGLKVEQAPGGVVKVTVDASVLSGGRQIVVRDSKTGQTQTAFVTIGNAVDRLRGNSGGRTGSGSRGDSMTERGQRAGPDRVAKPDAIRCDEGSAEGRDQWDKLLKGLNIPVTTARVLFRAERCESSVFRSMVRDIQACMAKQQTAIWNVPAGAIKPDGTLTNVQWKDWETHGTKNCAVNVEKNGKIKVGPSAPSTNGDADPKPVAESSTGTGGTQTNTTESK